MAGKKDLIKDSDRYSILCTDLTRCWLCGSTDRVALHEVFFGTANRKKSKEDGLVLPCCFLHHNGSSAGVHYDKKFRELTERVGQKGWEAKYKQEHPQATEDEVREAFIDRYGRNYIMED